MAALNQQSPLRISKESIGVLTQYLKKVLEFHKKYNDLRNKMEQIDIAYARYQTEDDKESGIVTAGIQLKNIIVPVVISQVDTFVGHLAEVYLSGYPTFPVVSNPDQMQEAEQLEAIIDSHATLGQYPRQLLMSFRDGIKYNFMPIEHSWEPIEQLQIVQSYLKPTEAAKLEQSSPEFTKIRRLDPYNTVWDMRCDPATVCYDGEFAGYIEMCPRIPLKRLINRNSKKGNLYNITEINSSTFTKDLMYYRDPPLINELMNNTTKKNSGQDFMWAQWMGMDEQGANHMGIKARTLMAGIYEKFTVYVRIIPSDFGIDKVPAPNSPQIWKLIMINGQYILLAERVYTAYDILPVLIGQPLEDGFGVQTKSIAEAQLPMQDSISKMFDIRFNAARRAISDRALFDTQLINEADVNAPVAAAKIPVRMSGLSNKTLADAYHPIPFDARGTDGVIQDAGFLLDFADKLSGANKPSRGEFQKGNKSVQEWVDTMSGSDNRLRLPAIMIEYQVMIPIKESIKLNIFQRGVQGDFQNFKTGQVYQIRSEQVEKMRSAVLGFRIADGFTPKSKLASTDFIVNLMQMISQSEILNQTLGGMLPKMIVHLAQLGGVRGLEQYLPKQTAQPQGAAPGTPAAQPAPAATP